MFVYETAELRVALDVPHKQFTNFFSTCVLYRVRTRVRDGCGFAPRADIGRKIGCTT